MSVSEGELEEGVLTYGVLGDAGRSPSLLARVSGACDAVFRPGLGVRWVGRYQQSYQEAVGEIEADAFRSGTLLEPLLTLRLTPWSNDTWLPSIEGRVGPSVLLPGGDLAEILEDDGQESTPRYGWVASLHAGIAWDASEAANLRLTLGPVARQHQLGSIGSEEATLSFQSMERGLSLTLGADWQLPQ